MLRGDVHAEVLKRLHELLRVNVALKRNKDVRKERVSHREVKHRHTTRGPRTRVPPGEALHHQLQVLLVVLQVVNKLFKVQLAVRGIFFSFQGFLQEQIKENTP